DAVGADGLVEPGRGLDPVVKNNRQVPVERRLRGTAGLVLGCQFQKARAALAVEMKGDNDLQVILVRLRVLQKAAGYFLSGLRIAREDKVLVFLVGVLVAQARIQNVAAIEETPSQRQPVWNNNRFTLLAGFFGQLP